jgi:hypothetical protein
MSHTLYLLDNEQKFFSSLPEAVRKGAKVEKETIQFQDSEFHLDIRMRNVKLEHPALKKLQKEAQEKTFTPEEVAKMAETVDLSKLSKDDMVELAFAWGPDVFSLMIAQALPLAKTADDVATLASLTNIRHGLLHSLTRTR